MAQTFSIPTERLNASTVHTNLPFVEPRELKDMVSYIDDAIKDHSHDHYIPVAVRYEFRVAEYCNPKGDVIKVGLELNQVTYNTFGTYVSETGWMPVSRVKVPA